MTLDPAEPSDATKEPQSADKIDQPSQPLSKRQVYKEVSGGQLLIQDQEIEYNIVS